MTCLHNHDQILEFLRKIFLKGFQIYQNYLCALKPHIRDKWVCGTETNMVQRRCPISFCYAILLNADWVGPMGKRTMYLKIWTVASDLPWTPSRVRLPVEPALFTFSKPVHGRNCGNHHWNASLCAADSLMDDWNSLSWVTIKMRKGHQHWKSVLIKVYLKINMIVDMPRLFQNSTYMYFVT